MINQYEYVFEPMADGRYQIRLEGEFVGYCEFPNPDYADFLLGEAGYRSREEFVAESWERIISLMKGEDKA